MINAVTFLGAVILLFLTYRIFFFLKQLKYLKDVNYGGARRWPLVSLVIPACNEQDTIQAALESLLKLNYPNYEIIAINDRSTDETGEIIRKLSLEDSRLKLVTIEELPVGWLGKLNALHVGAKMAQGEWILFSDADVHYSVDALKKAVSYAEDRQADFLAVSPSVTAPTKLLGAFLCQFMQQGSYTLNLNRIEDAKFSETIGIGAFNMARREWVEKIGGFQDIRLDVIDDGALAWKIKKAGGKTTFLSGVNELNLEWYKNFPALVRGLEKNAFAIFGYSLPRMLTFTVANWVGFCAAFIAPFYSTSELILDFHLLSLVSFLLMSGVSLQVGSGMSGLYAFTLPLTWVFVPLISLRAAFLNLKAGGISWRGTFYPLFLIRREQKFNAIDMWLGK
ncbi:MAG: glycosyltransferase family 2 protein [Bdellovibrionota bacterium]